jgi:hypothetical protein
MPGQQRIGLGLLAGIALLGSGCGAFIARTKIVGAQTAVASAQLAESDKKSPYEYTGALLYLEKAREEEAYGRFGAAIEFGGKAEELADKAKLNAATAEPDRAPEP